ncbi:hypothetical protein BY998_13224 [Methylobacterium sp. B4]|nr:hypothetical protein BY998_13224 [Methylobacterium sp. B4]
MKTCQRLTLEAESPALPDVAVPEGAELRVWAVVTDGLGPCHAN